MFIFVKDIYSTYILKSFKVSECIILMLIFLPIISSQTTLSDVRIIFYDEQIRNWLKNYV